MDEREKINAQEQQGPKHTESEELRYPKFLIAYVLILLIEIMPFFFLFYGLSGGAHGSSLFGINPKFYNFMFFVVVFLFPLWIIRICTTKKSSKDNVAQK